MKLGYICFVLWSVDRWLGRLIFFCISNAIEINHAMLKKQDDPMRKTQLLLISYILYNECTLELFVKLVARFHQ